MMLRTSRALSGISIPKAFSTARTEASACTVVQTPQIRCAQIHASRGSRPRRISSIPRNIVPELHASVTRPPLTSVSMRRWPSMRVTGSITTRAISVHLRRRLLFRLLFEHVLFLPGEVVADHMADGVSGGRRSHAGHDGPANLACRHVDAKAGRMRQPLVERRFRIPESWGSARNTSVPRLHRPARRIVPAGRRAVVVRLGSLAAHLEEAPSFAMALVTPCLYITPGVVMRAPLAL